MDSDLPHNPPRGISSRPVKTFLARLEAGEECLLLLDYDGTLSPFRADRDRAFPYDGVTGRLERLSATGRCTTVIVSGRSVDDVARLLGGAPVHEIWGCHGWERRKGGTTETLLPSGSEDSSALDAIQGWAEGRGFEGQVERKAASVAIHFRGVGEERSRSGRALLEDEAYPMALESGLSIDAFDGGIEFMVPGRDKGTAVLAILEEHGGRPAVAYLGDDATDEKAFEALSERGLRVLVRKQPRPTLADAWLVPPGELLGFLDRTIDTVEGLQEGTDDV